MSSILADTRLDLVAAIKGATDGASLTIASNRVFRGYKARGQAADIWTDVNTNGPMALVGPSKNIRFDNLGFGPATFPIQVYLAKSKGADFNGDDIENLVANILTRLTKPSNYSSCGVPTSNPLSIMPRMVTYQGLSYDTLDTDGLVALTFSAEVPDPV